MALASLQRDADRYEQAATVARAEAAAAAAGLEAESRGAEAAERCRALRLQAARGAEQARAFLLLFFRTARPPSVWQATNFAPLPCQVRVLQGRLAVRQKLEADSAAAQDDVAALRERLSGLRTQAAAAAQQTALLQSIQSCVGAAGGPPSSIPCCLSSGRPSHQPIAASTRCCLPLAAVFAEGGNRCVAHNGSRSVLHLERAID